MNHVHRSFDPDPDAAVFAAFPQGGAKGLWAAMLEYCLEDLGIMEHDRPQRKITFYEWLDARAWFMYRGPPIMGSFPWVIDVLEFDKKKWIEKINNTKCKCCGRKYIEEPCLKKVKSRRSKRARNRERK